LVIGSLARNTYIRGLGVAAVLITGVVIGVQLAGPTAQHPAAAAPGATVQFREAGFSFSQRDPVHDDDYPHPAGATDPWGGFEPGECTSFVAWRVTSRDHVDIDALSTKLGRTNLNAFQWDRFAGLGFTIDTHPAPGAVAWSDKGDLGHVAWVRDVRSDGTMIIEDYNEIEYHRYHSWVVPTSGSGFTGFIHFEAANQTVNAAGPHASGGSTSAASPLRVTTNPGGRQGSQVNVQGNGQTLQGNGQTIQGNGQTIQGNGGPGGGGQQPAPTLTPTPTQQAQQPPPPSEPVFTVMHTDETLPDGVWFRNTPHTNDTDRVTGHGVYKGEQVRVRCYAWGDAVGPYGNTVWYWVTNVTRPTINGQPNTGYLNTHYVDDGQTANHPHAGIPTC
jgi:hypothetical protein